MPASRVQSLDDRPKPRVDRGVAFLPSLPRVRLVIVGAGHVGQAVGSLAAQADFDVWVVDDRHQYANAERFPTARRILVGPIEQVLGSLEVTPRTYALIVTRGHGHDQEALYHLAPTPASYVGLIGSRRKIRLIFEGLREQGIAEDHLSRVTAPVGFDIGSQSVIEIAISIVAELIARRNLGPRAISPREPAGSSRAFHRSRREDFMIAALVPAAGRSVRMGRPKLLMDFDGETLIHRVVTGLREGGVDRVVVVPPADGPDAAAIAAEAAVGGCPGALSRESARRDARLDRAGTRRAGRRAPPVSVLLTPGDVPVSPASWSLNSSKSRAKHPTAW